MLRVVLGVVIALTAPDAAASCGAELADWTVLSGELAPGATCGTLVMTSDAGAAPFYNGGELWQYSVALAAHRAAVRVPYEIAFDLERLTPGPWRVKVQVLGVAVRISTDAIAFIGDPAQQVSGFYEVHPELARPGRHRVTVRQTTSEVTVFYDGKQLEHLALVAPAEGTIALGLLGAPGHRTRIALHDIQVRQSSTARLVAAKKPQ